MSAIRDGRLPIELDRERHLLFSLNVIDEMQDKFGGYDKLGEAMRGPDAMRNLRWMITQLLNEGAEPGEPELTEREVGRLIHIGNFVEVRDAMFAAFAMGNRGTTTAGDDDDDDDDNDDDEGESESPKNAEMGGA